MVVGAATRMFAPTASLWIYGIGTMLFCLMRLRTEYTGRDVTIKRLRRQQLLACVFFIITLMFMSMQTYQYGPMRSNEWVLALAIGTVLELYTAWRLPSLLDK